MEHNFEQLKAHILALSNAHDFESARKEWHLIGVEVSEEFDNCPCGQEIKEHCYIQNSLNGNRTYVGNVCINRFIGIETGNLFAGLKRIAKDDSANANKDVIEHAYRFGYIFENEHKFLMETRHTRNLSEKQLAWKQKINRRITTKTVVQRRTAGRSVPSTELEDLVPDHEPEEHECSRCGAGALVESATCCACEYEVNFGEETSVERKLDGSYRVFVPIPAQVKDDFGQTEILKCVECSGETWNVAFDSFCGYCRHMAEK